MALLESAVVVDDAAVVVDNPTPRLLLLLYFCARDTCDGCCSCIMRRITPLSRRIPKNVRFGPKDWGDSSDRIVVDDGDEVSSMTASEQS